MTDSFLNGIDVSHFNESIDWRAVAADPSGLLFAYAKATEGVDLLDPDYRDNYAGIKANGMLAGASHFYRPQDPALAQANFFISTVGSVSGVLPPMLDVEVEWDGITPQDYAAGVLQWLQEVGSRLNCAPIIYTRASFWNTYLGNFSAFAAYPLWISEYTDRAEPTLPDGATGYTIWQHSQSGTIAGMKHLSDLDRFRGTSAQLQALVCAASTGAQPGVASAPA